MASQKTAWFGAGFVAGVASLFLIERMVCFVIPYSIKEPQTLSNNANEDTATVCDDSNRDQPAANLHLNRNNGLPVVCLDDEIGSSVSPLRTLQISRHESSRASPQEILKTPTGTDDTRKSGRNIVVTADELKGDDDGDDDEDDDYLMMAPTPRRLFHKGKGKASVRPASPPPIIDSAQPTVVDKRKSKAPAHTLPPAKSVPSVAPRRAPFELNENAGMAEQDTFDSVIANSKQDVNRNGEGGARGPTSTSSACASQPPTTKESGRRISEPITRRQANTSGSKALQLDSL
ncbi:hypothetical protein PMIN06_002666 [Paraphaeosphaeria minitans]